MPSPFPGMDPFIEAWEWNDFQITFNVYMSERLNSAFRASGSLYVSRIRLRTYVDLIPAAEEFRNTTSDVWRKMSENDQRLLSCEARERSLEILEVQSKRVITVIETLSPGNKRRNGPGAKEYLNHRQEVLSSDAHLVELDLLRRGAHPVENSGSPEPVGDYRAVISRANRRPRLAVYAWPLMHPLPTIPIPLSGPDEHVELDLQRTFTTVYDRAAYALSLNYTAELDPPLRDEIKSWLREQPVPSA